MDKIDIKVVIFKRTLMPQSSNKEYSLLLVEDDKINQVIFIELLKSCNFKIDIVDNGRAAVNILKKNRYDIIFMDIYMPVMDGIEATKIIRKSDKITPIILLSAYADEIDIVKVNELGMNAFLSKPIDMKKLEALLSSYFEFFGVNDKIEKINNLYYDSLPIPNFKSIDTSVGLKNMNMDRRLYLKTLIEFSKRYNVESVEKSNYQDFSRNIHTIKGLALSIGAMEIAKLAKVVENSASEEKINDFLYGLEKATKEIKHLLKEE